MIMKANKQIGFIYKNNESIDKILKDGEVVFERGFLREKTSTTLPITFGGVGKDLKDYKIYGNTVQSKLPSGYTQVDYIESSGTQYIDTGVNADYKLSLDIKLTDILNVQKHMGALRNNGNSTYTRHHFQTKNSGIEGNIVYYVDTVYYRIKTTTEMTRPHIYKIDVYNNKITYDNETPIAITRTDFDTQLNYWLFWRNRNDSLGSPDKGNFRIYYCKMYVQDVLVRNFIPCYRNSDNEVGLYDLVNNVFYTNQGTDSFTYGSIAPTPDAPIEIVSCGDLITDSQDENYGKYKIPVNVRSDNLISQTIYQTNTNLSDNGEMVSNNNYLIMKQTNIKPLSKYILSENQTAEMTGTNTTPIRVCAYDKNDNFLSLVLKNVRTEVKRYVDEFIVPENTDYILIGFRNSDTNIELVESTDTNIYLDEPLRKIDEYSDYIDFINGKVVRQLGEVILNGSEDIVRNNTNTTGKYRFSLGFTNINMITVAGAGDINPILSDKYISKNRNQTYANTTGIGYGTGSTTYKNIILYDENLSSFTTEQFKTWLQSNNVIVDYVLATPTEENIELPNIPTVDGNNTLNIETEITPSQVYIKYKSNT